MNCYFGVRKNFLVTRWKKMQHLEIISQLEAIWPWAEAGEGQGKSINYKVEREPIALTVTKEGGCSARMMIKQTCGGATNVSVRNNIPVRHHTLKGEFIISRIQKGKQDAGKTMYEKWTWRNQGSSVGCICVYMHMRKHRTRDNCQKFLHVSEGWSKKILSISSK